MDFTADQSGGAVETLATENAWMTDNVLARLAELKTMDIVALKAMWRDLFAAEPPPYNRKFLESRLAYRIQELAYGGLKPETLKRLAALAEELEPRGSRSRSGNMPVAGTRLLREWQGVAAHRHGAGRRLRVSGPALQVALGHCPRDHRHALERLAVLRAAQPEGSRPMKTAASSKPIVRKLRCAVYTRKSSEEGLDMEFNSLDAQREACEAYVASQRSEGWVLVPDRYDDGGISGATLERPALKRLLRDVEAGLVDVVVVYKIDRLSRSLTDFSRLVEVFEANDVTFVSVTQSFNTTTSMGRLTLNILLSFAQFEREVIGERIRDKFAGLAEQGHVDGRQRAARLSRREPQAAHRGGGGRDRPHDLRAVPADRLGNHAGAHAQCRGHHQPRRQADRQGLCSTSCSTTGSTSARPSTRASAIPASTRPSSSRDLWDKVRSIIAESPRKRAGQSRRQTPALLQGPDLRAERLCDDAEPTRASKGGSTATTSPPAGR